MASNDDVLIRVEGVSKRFCRNLKRSLWYGVEDTIADCVGLKGGNPQLRRDEFWAVDDVSFELRRGECLGLMGHNGAGKTTVLKMLNGLIKPDRGRIEMRGRVGALIALGAGFNPILTGRENIYVNGSVLGLSKREIDAKIGEIVDFAEIGDFIDAPVQSYSSGMGVRLGFAVATAMEQDILLLDEVLAVGDVAFRTKCFNRIERMKSRAATILVSHNVSDMARVCTRSLVRTGSNFESLSIQEGIRRYQTTPKGSERPGFVKAEPGFELFEADVQPRSVIWQSKVVATLDFTSPIALEGIEARITFMNQEHTVLAEWRSTHNRVEIAVAKGRNKLAFDIGPIGLKPGSYFVGYVLSKPGLAAYLILSFAISELVVEGSFDGLSSYQLHGSLVSADFGSHG